MYNSQVDLSCGQRYCKTEMLVAAFPIYRGSKHVPVEVRSDFVRTSCFESVALSTPGLEKGCTLGKVTYTSVKK